jgi:hypothetical protein
VVIGFNENDNQMNTTTVNHIPRQFSGLGDVARVCLIGSRCLSLSTSAFWFQTESQPNVTQHHPNSAEALGTLYLTVRRATQETLEKTGLTREFSRITC